MESLGRLDRSARDWLKARGGDGVFQMRNCFYKGENVRMEAVLAWGEFSPFHCDCWTRLCAAGLAEVYVYGHGKRIRLIEPEVIQ